MFNKIRCAAVLILIAFAVPCAARQNFLKRLGSHLGKLEWSQAALVGANAADTWSSFRPDAIEINPLLAQHGQFTAVSAVIKLSVSAAQIFGQRYILTHYPGFAETHRLERKFTFVNYAVSGMYTGVAAHNASLK
jgi:hypothetical protein